MIKKSWRKGVVALAVSAALGVASVNVYASGESTGNVVGALSGAPAGTYTVVIKNDATGFNREVSVQADGSFRFTQLPVGEYQVVVSREGKVVAQDNIRVTLGGTSAARFDLASRGGAEVIEVVGARPSAVDLTASDSGMVIGDAEIDALPVGRNLTSVALLAPGTVQGNAAFGNLASFSGSSVSENGCYINGLNVTNSRTGLGCGTIPFEFYKEFQVKTGGYSAQFGRTTGGVINAVSKSGSNEFEFGGSYFFAPDSLRGEGSVAKGRSGGIYRDTRKNTLEQQELNLWASGPIIPDRLFFFVMASPRLTEQGFTDAAGRTAGPTAFTKQEAEGTFWGTKIDFEITSDHRLEYFAFSDQLDTAQDGFAYDRNTQVIGAYNGSFDFENGGENSSLKYVGNLTDTFTMTAMVGKTESSASQFPTNTVCPTVTDSRNNPSNPARACGPGGSLRPVNDTRDVKRLDFEWAVGDHVIRFGYDDEEIASTNITDPVGGGAWTYNTVNNNESIEGTDYRNTTGAAHDFASKRVFKGGGAFTSENKAIYIEDQWTINDQWFLTVGLRDDTNENFNKLGQSFVKIEDQIAPRLGVTFDPNGDGSSKIFANYGKYYLPIPTNTNYRVGGGIRDETFYYRFTGINAADGTPTGLTEIAHVVQGSGAVPEKALASIPELESMFLEEYIIGYQWEISPEYNALVRATYRDTQNAIDDYCDKNTDPSGHGLICTLFNPGKGGTFGKDGTTDADGDGDIDPESLDADGKVDPGSLRYYTAAELGMPKAERTYEALQFELNHRAKEMSWTFLYTWSRSYGNNEGGVKSDNDQIDHGITTDFDFRALMDGARGYLPNDRRHVFKFYGNYKLTDDFHIGWNSRLSDGRPINATGRGYPVAADAPGYGDTYWVKNGNTWVFNRRGTMGRTPWVFDLDVTASYSFNIGGLDVTASLDIFNILNTQQTLQVEERAESSVGNPNQMWGLTKVWQNPRSVRFGLETRF